MTQFLELFGTKLSLMFAGVALLYFVWSSAPIWWASLRAFRAGNRLVNPGSFIFFASALVYGGTTMGAMGGAALSAGSQVLAEASHPWIYALLAPGSWLAIRMVSNQLPLLAVLHILLTWAVTRQLESHWTSWCARGLLSSKGAR
ncbi:hypothetical protein [uncultured Stenotrophomonas sp.]|uniref:hypothetical protein n=1 Tax=uncultured Stenotrophomonas sp. TaxID=165438 RepID=UPI0028E9FD1F|nr:hypothetical protein [uncultured Stenotrophomonas sp.]